MGHFYFMLIYLAMSLLVAMMGEDRKFGFWGYFFASLLLSPLLGFLLMIASDPVVETPPSKGGETIAEKA